MDLTKKMRGVIADIIRGNYSFFKIYYRFVYIDLLTDIARCSHRPHQQQQQQQLHQQFTANI